MLIIKIIRVTFLSKKKPKELHKCGIIFSLFCQTKFIPHIIFSSKSLPLISKNDILYLTIQNINESLGYHLKVFTYSIISIIEVYRGCSSK